MVLKFSVSAGAVLPEPARCEHCVGYPALSHFSQYHELLGQVSHPFNVWSLHDS